MTLKNLIRSHEMTVSGFAKEMGVARNTDYNWINKDSCPTFVQAVHIAVLFRVTLNDLVDILCQEE